MLLQKPNFSSLLSSEIWYLFNRSADQIIKIIIEKKDLKCLYKFTDWKVQTDDAQVYILLWI